MSEYQAQIVWQRQSDQPFLDRRYSRAHSWKFDGGVTVPASSAVHSVPLPYSKAENVDPEEALVAAISSCHMLSFLYVAAKASLVVDAYDDVAVGTMTKDSRGRQAITTVVLAPKIIFSGVREPHDALVEKLHHEAHERCYIANSVRSVITVSGQWRYEAGSANR
ncbi:MAG TPA: OsmC family protein [Steroidobacteraceae bacterium]